MCGSVSPDLNQKAIGNREFRKQSFSANEKTKRLDTETHWIDFGKTHILCHENKVIKIETEIGIEIVQTPRTRKTLQH